MAVVYNCKTPPLFFWIGCALAYIVCGDTRKIKNIFIHQTTNRGVAR